MTSYPHHLTITSSVSPDYEIMNKGYTDAICILGFADCAQTLYGDVFPVTDIPAALAAFSGDGINESSLLKGLIEVYSTGCRDIYLYPIAPMSDYVAPDDRDAQFWTDLTSWYADALGVLDSYDDIDVLIPYDADIDEGDYVDQFAAHCQNVVGSVLRLTYFSYQGDATATFYGEDYHIILVNGIGTFHFPDHFTNDYSSGMAATFAGVVSRIDVPVPPDNRNITTVILFSSDYEDDEETLETNRVVGFRKTAAYKRVFNRTLTSTLSFTRASNSSDFSTLYAVHTIQRLLRQIDKLELVGTASYFAQDALRKLFDNWETKDYVLNIDSQFQLMADTLYVNVTLVLPYPVGVIELGMTVGPVF